MLQRFWVLPFYHDKSLILKLYSENVLDITNSQRGAKGAIRVCNELISTGENKRSIKIRLEFFH